MLSATLHSDHISALHTPAGRLRSGTSTGHRELFTRTNSGMQAAAGMFWGDTAGYRVARQLLREFSSIVAGAERLGWDPQQIREACEPSREVLATSALFSHCQRWPRGYAGDFQAIETLLNGVNRSSEGTLAWYLEQTVLTSAGAEQHRNKLTYQAQQVRQALQRKPDARVLALACGGCWEWQTLCCAGAEFTGEVVLQDVDAAALELAGQRVSAVTTRYRRAPGHPFWVAAELARTERFDLVTAGGLFDYLSDRVASHLLGVLFHKLLAPGGSLVFTNIITGNEWRPLMHYGLDWQIQERSADELRQLCVRAGIPASAVKVSVEPSGMTLIVEAVRHAG